MKKTLLVLFSVVAVAGLIYATEIDYGYVTKRATAATNYLAAGQTSQGTMCADVIFPAEASTTIRLLSLDATNDTAAAQGTIRFYSGTARTTVTATHADTVTNVAVASSDAFSPGDVVVFQRKTLTNTIDLIAQTLINTNGSTNLIFTNAIGIALTSNDYVYKMGKVVTNAMGIGTYRRDGPGIFAAQLRQPMLLRLLGTNSAITINHATVKYE